MWLESADNVILYTFSRMVALERLLTRRGVLKIEDVEAERLRVVSELDQQAAQVSTAVEEATPDPATGIGGEFERRVKVAMKSIHGCPAMLAQTIFDQAFMQTFGKEMDEDDGEESERTK